MFTQEELDGLRLKDQRRRSQLEGRKGNSLKSLADRHHEILRLKALGLSNTTIADKMDMHKQRITQVVNSPVGVAQLELIRGDRTAKAIDMLDQVKAVLPDALKVMENALNGGDLEKDYNMRKLQLKTAENMFSMCGMGPVTKVDARTLNARVTGADIKNLVEEASTYNFVVDDVIEVKQEEGEH